MTRNRILFTFLAIAFLGDLVSGVKGAAWPPIRDDLTLSYVQVGLLLSVPSVVGTVFKPASVSSAMCGGDGG